MNYESTSCGTRYYCITEPELFDEMTRYSMVSSSIRWLFSGSDPVVEKLIFPPSTY